MDRGSSKHSPRVDDQMAQEVRGTVQGTAGARAEEWKMAEPSGEDQPQVSVVPDQEYGRGEPNGVGSPQGEEFSRFFTSESSKTSMILKPSLSSCRMSSVRQVRQIG